MYLCKIVMTDIERDWMLVGKKYMKEELGWVKWIDDIGWVKWIDDNGILPGVKSYSIIL